MEQHPVPRNITGFQFHLIGDMTLRQFCYLSGGVGIGYLFYRASPLPGMITVFIAFTTAFIGFAFAFIPVQERPLDKWLAAFIRSILSPTRFLWQKNNYPPDILLQPAVRQIKVISPVQYQAQNEAKEKLRAYLKTLPSPPHEALNRAEKNYIEKTLAMFNLSPVVAVASLNADIPQSVPYQAIPETIAPLIPKTINPLETKVTNPLLLDSIKPIPTVLPSDKVTISKEGKALQVAPVTQSAPQIDPEQKRLSEQLQKTLGEKEALERQLKKLQNEWLKETTPQIIKPPTCSSPKNPKTSATVYSVKPQEIKTEIGIPLLPQTPNILSGVIKDPQRKLLPNVIITIKDKNTMPLRAFKTNKLGQFATATPLPNGTYLVCAEDPMKRYIFDIAQITLSGKLFSPIEIIAKGEKELLREQLTKQIFGSANI